MAPDGGPMRELLRVTAPVDLGEIDPRSTPGLPGTEVTGEHRKAWARGQVELVGGELGQQQEMLFAMAKAGSDRPAHRVLLVLQAMDGGGKDGTIKRVAGAMNPLGLHIRSFGPPTPQELRHDFLWRIRRALPPPGYVGMFNRSHYEDVLIARVGSLVPEATWRARYDEINSFERELADGGVTLVKVMLHISYAEQGERLLERLTDPPQALEVQPLGRRLPGPLGRLPGRVRRGAEPVRHGRRAVVRGAGEPEVVPGLGGGPPAAGDVRHSRSGVSACRFRRVPRARTVTCWGSGGA
ncbi:Polyphosphate kinase 2 (PPK2) [Micromonospora cremea]|uniref:Polyphosphate kinase 2 (PPK2) n=1 Tax=Micromonospora cremea TaxID=709881 RepID=A0A1N5ZPM2_9ACTN|nr:Polyphosphate kinase 2 (PPK2) [Micromonospora cremea]